VAVFNYLVYHLAQRAAGRTPQTFAAYPASPGTAPDRANHSGDIDDFGPGHRYCGIPAGAPLQQSPSGRAGCDRNQPEEFAAKEAHTAWEEIGFTARWGLLRDVVLGLLLFVPIIIYQNLVLPVFILPSAQALGMWGRVLQFFTVIFTFFEMGTSTAFIKYLSEYRINDPRKGIMFGQVFVWWQALSGAFQTALVVILACTVLPRTAYAIYAWSVIIHMFINIPGFYRIMRHALTGLQRRRLCPV